jgi:hypothetical protein
VWETVEVCGTEIELELAASLLFADGKLQIDRTVLQMEKKRDLIQDFT